MTPEALSGSAYISREHTSSPLEAERSLNPRNNHNFPENPKEFLDVLRQEIPAVMIDWLRLGNDLTRGWIERAELRRELRNGLRRQQGDGSFVAINPGYGAIEWWYYPLEDFLELNGYLPVYLHPNSIVNDVPIEQKKERNMEFIIDLRKQSGRKVHIIGDSQGGLGTAAMAVDYPKEFQESVEDVWLIGAPKPRRVNVVVGIAYLWSQLWHKGNDFRLVRNLEKLDEFVEEGVVPFRSIYRYSDPILPDGEPIGEHFRTGDSHTGGAVNPPHLKLIVSTWAAQHHPSETRGTANLSIVA